MADLNLDAQMADGGRLAFGDVVVICPFCKHGIDAHGSDPGGPCGCGGCPCFMTPNGIACQLIGAAVDAVLADNKKRRRA